MSYLYFNKESDYSEENYFSLSLNKKKRVVMRAMRKKLQKQLAAR